MIRFARWLVGWSVGSNESWYHYVGTVTSHFDSWRSGIVIDMRVCTSLCLLLQISFLEKLQTYTYPLSIAR